MPLKLAIIGTGKVAREQYVPFLATQPDVLLGYYNRTPETAQQLAAQFPGPVFSTFQAAADWKPDSALVLTSETARCDISHALIEAGVPRLFFEKPLVAAHGQAHVTEEDFIRGRAMLARADARRCQTAIVFNYRFFEQTRAAERIIESRRLGAVTNITGLVHFACWSHCIDLIRFFAGDIARITALAGAVSRHSPELNIRACDLTAAFLTTSGATGSLIGTLAMKWQHPLYELTFTCESGRIHMRDLDGTLEILDGAMQAHETISLGRDRSRWDQYTRSFHNAVGAYLASVRSGAAPPVAAIEGLRELQIEAALQRSIAQCRPVNVQDEFPINAPSGP